MYTVFIDLIYGFNIGTVKSNIIMNEITTNTFKWGTLTELQ